MKKILSISLVLILLITSSIVFADNNNKSKDDAEILKVYKVTENGLVEVSVEEYLKAPNHLSYSRSGEKEIIQSRIYEGGWSYNENSNYLVRRTDLRERISRIVDNTLHDEMAHLLVGYSTEQSYEINVSASYELKNAIEAGVSFTWRDSSSVEESYTLDIPAHKYGWWEFDPIMNKSVGVATHYGFWGDIDEVKDIEAYSPNEVGGKLDGYLVAMSSYTQPTD